MDSVLHGREEPLGLLRAALASALDGRGQLALVSGEAGIGKSALAHAVAQEAATLGARTTWGRAWEFADAPPYFPVSPCLRSIGVTHEGRSAFQLWEDVVASLVDATKESAVVWIVEDLHAADLGTLDLLTFLAQPLRAMRALVVATTRDRDPRLSDRVWQRLTRIRRDGTPVQLGPLLERDVAAVAETILGRAPSPPVLRRLVAVTGGNPLFVVESARALRSNPALAGADAGGARASGDALGALPETVRQVVVGRVDLLSAETRSALACGAVLGREFTAATVARIMDALPARVIDALLPALKSGIVTEPSPGRFLFSHVLVRDAVESAIDGGERARLHGLADVALGAREESADVLLERARHALAALPHAGDAAHVLALAKRAGALLQRGGAFDRAFELEQRVSEARRAGLLPPASGEERLRAAETARAAGRADVARAICEETIALARATNDVVLLARAALLHAVDVRPGVVDRAQVAFIEEARAALGESEPGLACRLLARHATALQPCPDQSVPSAMAREAIARARETDDEAALLDVLEQAAWGLYAAPLRERIAIAMELRDRAGPRRDRVKVLGAQIALAFYHNEDGDFDAFHRATESVLALSDEIGLSRYRWRPLLIASMEAALLGHVADSDRYVAEAKQLAALIDDPAFGLSFAMHDLLRVRLLRRDDEVPAAFATLEKQLAPVSESSSHIALIRCVCHARILDVAATREALRGLGNGAAGFLGDATLVGMLAESYAVAGTDEDRRIIRGVLAGLGARELAGDALSFMDDGTVVRVLGLLDAALGDLERAHQELVEARAIALKRRHAPWVAQTAFELASVLERLGRGDEARAFAAESAQIARDLGLPGLLRDTPGSISAGLERRVAAVSVAKAAGSWTVQLGHRWVTVKDSRGMQLLARLVEQPDEDIHVLTLASDDGAGVAESNAGELLDEQARTSYRRRVSDLDELLAEAESHDDAGRIAKLRAEREALLSELARAVGLGGRRRVAASATERARVNVQRRLKDAISRIAEADADLGRYFERALRTGTFCSFRP